MIGRALTILVVGWWLSGGLVSVASDRPTANGTASVARIDGQANVGASGAEARQLDLPAEPWRYSSDELPPHVAEVAARFDNTPPENPISDHGATLGRVLFYDRTLSINGTTSCASCHRQSVAFSDDRRRSVGFDGRELTRNSMSLINLRYYPDGRFFWDERAGSLEEQVLMPIENELEMGHDLNELVTQLAGDPLYPPLFAAAFGDTEVTRERIARALAQFIRSIVAFDSAYDRGRAEVASVFDPFPHFTDEQNEGKRLFFGEARCASCHVSEVPVIGQQTADRLLGSTTPDRQSAFFFIEGPVVNGIDIDQLPAIDSAFVDPGAGGYSGEPEDYGRFKSPSLRCVEVTGPYMHDGRMITLESVVEHYNWSIRPHLNLDPRLQRLEAAGLAMPQWDVDAVVAFLKTLTDHSVLTDERFSDPFVRP